MVHLGAFLEKRQSICPHKKNMLIFYELIAGQFFFTDLFILLLLFLYTLNGGKLVK